MSGKGKPMKRTIRLPIETALLIARVSKTPSHPVRRLKRSLMRRWRLRVRYAGPRLRRKHAG
jgi:hypothetical protein